MKIHYNQLTPTPREQEQVLEKSDKDTKYK